MIQDVFFGTTKYWWLSNFAAFQIKVFGEKWPTPEHAYQAQKFLAHPAISYEILFALSPYEAKVIAHTHREKVRASWPALKLSVMEQVLRAKCDQHAYVERNLLETGDRHLVENSLDNFWGSGAHGRGENHLGKLWMKLRAELRILQ